MAKVNIDVDHLKALHTMARRNDNLAAWAELALEWAEAADAKVRELRQIIERCAVHIPPECPELLADVRRISRNSLA